MPQSPNLDITVEETGVEGVHLVSSPEQQTSLLQHLTSAAQTTQGDPSLGRDQFTNTDPAPTPFTPVAGWVAKARLAARWNELPSNAKVFFNMCSHPIMPVTKRPEDASLSLGPIGQVTDKEGNQSIVLDACVHPDILAKARTDFAFKIYLAQLAGLWAWKKHGFLLINQGPTFPNMLCKGTIQQQRVITYRRTLQQALALMLSRQGPLLRRYTRRSNQHAVQPTPSAQKPTEALAGMMQTRLLAQDRVSPTLQYASAIDLALRQATVAVDPLVRQHIARILPKRPFPSVIQIGHLLDQALEECGPSVLLYNTGIRAYLRVKAMDEAHTLLQTMIATADAPRKSREEASHPPLHPTAASFTPLIHALLDTRPAQAITLYREMTRRSLVPKTAPGYAVLLQVQAYLGDDAGVSRIWAEMHATGIRPSPSAHSTHLSFWWARGNMDVCVEAFQAALRDKALPLHRQRLLTDLALAFAREGYVESAVQVLPFLKAPLVPNVRRTVLQACFLQGEGWLAKHAWDVLADIDRSTPSSKPEVSRIVKESLSPHTPHEHRTSSSSAGTDPGDLEPSTTSSNLVKMRARRSSWSEAQPALSPHLAFSGTSSLGHN
ncbi:hypothetical protein BJ684DRAFT_19766 [Piptocephalis cylindrospora]|uniref:PIH1 N-terminal domain-containing protein n=1 Tax=Piptocephalis cylindrospora TaxID=1907219 RepID=A0A4P9Y4Q7_9FUNG|nr:hypothetical protein BJ684DRAFT_19766 [Piptocephalis cylindrospora]|eukprot:RKP13774.1 hypothetical protein BJ684DRAFT_19766 [Piptocephalis cylindrospora]